MRKTFEYVENIEGQFGFLEPGAPDEFTPGDALTVAHDCIEHFKGDDGSVDREFMAFGCMYFIRHETGNYFTDKRFDEALASDLSDEVWSYYIAGSELKDFKKRSRYPEFVNQIAQKTEMYIKSNLESCENEISEDQIIQFIEGLKYWVNEGYKKAKKRYRNPFFTFETFNQIISEIEDLRNRILFEIGDRIVVKWDPNYCRVNIKHIPIYEQY